MMNHRSSAFKYSALLFSVAMVMSLSSCVSVNLKPKAPTKSKTYKFEEPQKPFDEMASDQADHAWQNQKNGNTIAILTECSESRDPSLASIESETINALNNPQKLTSEAIEFSDRGGLRTVVEGQVDGVSVKMDLVTFKKDSCSYTLSYIARSKSFEKNQDSFEQFLKGFKVP